MPTAQPASSARGCSHRVYNPITMAVLGFQKAMWVAGQGVAEYPDFLLGRMAIAFVIGLVLLFGFQRVFARLQGNFAQVV